VTDWFPALVYLLCFLTAAACALLLARNYWRTGARLLLWSSLCFLLLAANSLVVILDLLVVRTVDFRLARHLLSLGAVGVLLFGFIWDLED
jgi:Family of unknown function (DUF5985)